MSENQDIQIILHHGIENGEEYYWVESPQIPGLCTQGDNIVDALEMTIDAYKCLTEPYFQGYKIDRIVNAGGVNLSRECSNNPERIRIELDLKSNLRPDDKDEEAMIYVWSECFWEAVQNEIDNKDMPPTLDCGSPNSKARIYIVATPEELEALLEPLHKAVEGANILYQKRIREQAEERDRREWQTEDLRERFMKLNDKIKERK